MRRRCLTSLSTTPYKTLLAPISVSLFASAAFALYATCKLSCLANEIARYTARRVTEEMRIDGRLDERAWQSAPDSFTTEPT